MTDWYKVGYWEGVRTVLTICAPLVASGAFVTYAFRDILGNALLAAWGLFAFGMVVAWVYGLRVAALAGEEKKP